MLPDSAHSPASFVIVASAVTLLIGFAKAGLGGGVGVLATPLMTLVIPPLDAAGFLLPLLCACDLFALWTYRDKYDPPSIRALLPGSLAGIAAGTLFLWLFSEHADNAERGLAIVIGAVAIAFVLWSLLRDRVLAHIPPKRPGAAQGWLLGGVSGFGSMIAHAGGPPATIYLVGVRLDREIFVGTTVILFAVINFVKLVPYAALDMINPASLKTSLLFLPLAPVGVYLGIWANRRVPQRAFDLSVQVILLLTGLQLLSGLNIVALFGGR